MKVVGQPFTSYFYAPIKQVMYHLLLTHSTLRYFVLVLLILVIVLAYLGWQGKKTYGRIDGMAGMLLFSLTHTQLLVGLILYFVSPHVQFSGAAMKDANLRYWTTEHIVMMLISITLITMARITSKKMTDDTARHKRMFIFNLIALIIILMAIAMSHRGFFSLPTTAI